MYVSFVLYTIFSYWVIFLEGATVIEGWRSFFLIDWFAASLTATELKFYVGISWLAMLAITLYMSLGST